LNETLCRALLRARLTEEDVAAHLQVDPKTVRRWLEGRVPYLRHRWAIAAMLGLDETDLWPQLRASRTRPQEVWAIYPHRDAVPGDVWLRLFGSARHEIGILEDVGTAVVHDRQIMAVLTARVRSGVGLRICLAHTKESRLDQLAARAKREDGFAAGVADVLDLYTPLGDEGQVELRLYGGSTYSSTYYSDDQVLVVQHVYGIAADRGPVLHLRRTQAGDLADAYLDAFEHAWADPS
jgi:hypothetical protein